MFLYITWNISPDLAIGPMTLHLYGILFVAALFAGGVVVWQLFRRHGISQDDYTTFLVYAFLGIFLGARLAHCLFYEPAYYLAHPLEILLPVTIHPDGRWEFVGYVGLASHGAMAGILLAIWLFSRKIKQPFLKVTDYIAIAAPITCSLIRVGNLMNSEIVGRPTDVPWAFVFTSLDAQPRHPAQLYEALAYLAVFIIVVLIYKYVGERNRAGFYLGVVSLLLGSARIAIEAIKEPQSAFEATMLFNMGQWLSMPFVVAGIVIIALTARRGKAGR